MRGRSVREVDATGSDSVSICTVFAILGVGYKAFLGEDGGHTHVLIAVLGEVAEGVELGVVPLFKQLLPKLGFVRISFENNSSSGL